MIPELIGRIPIICPLQSLNADALVKILSEPKNAIIKQYKQLFLMDGIDLEFEKKAIQYIAKKTLENKTGARGLRAVIEDILSDIMFSAPSDSKIKKITISEKYAKSKNISDLKIDY